MQIYFLLIIVAKTPNLIGGQVVHFCLTTYSDREGEVPTVQDDGRESSAYCPKGTVHTIRNPQERCVVRL